MDLTIENFKNWTPARVRENGETLFADWIYLGEKRFTEPFHEETVRILMREPHNTLHRHRTPLEFLGEIYKKSKGIAPKGFIFHVSRSGSTLVSQMLAALAKNIVISEAAPLDSIIRSRLPEEEKINGLRWLVNAFGQKRFEDEENLFIKFDSWAAFSLPLIEQAFPGIPWIFLYRTPVEVIASQLIKPGQQMIPGLIREIFPQMDLPEILQFSTEERFARTIAAFFRAALENAESPRGKFVNYNQLPGAVAGEICRHFGVGFTRREIERMLEKSRFNAKIPQISFSPGADRKRLKAGAEIVRFAEKFVDPLYRELEKSARRK